MSAGGPARGMARAVAIGRSVFLRRPTERDRAEFIALRCASRDHLERWEPLPPRGFDPFGDDAFDREMRLRRTETEERLLVCLVEGGSLVGRVSIGGIFRGPLMDCRLGYWIGAAHARRGYMTEAVRLAAAYAFNALGLHRVEANIMPSNAASRGVLVRAGFSQEGFSPRYLQIRGRWEDHERWALLIEDYRGPRGARLPIRWD